MDAHNEGIIHRDVKPSNLMLTANGNLVQETEDRANYRIEGVAPGDYTVTAIEHPS